MAPREATRPAAWEQVRLVVDVPSELSEGRYHGRYERGGTYNGQPLGKVGPNSVLSQSLLNGKL